MSNFTDRMSYNSYAHAILSKESPREKLMRKWYPCPGCKLHPIAESRRKVLFRAYVSRPQTSHGVYWRTHQSEYKLMLQNIHDARSKQ